MSPLLNQNLSLGFRIFRFIIYAFLTYLLAEFIRYDAAREGLDTRFSEQSLTELAQSILLLLSCFANFYVYRTSSEFKYVGLATFALTSASFFREQDVYFETYLGQTTWMYPVLAITLPVGYLLIRNYREFARQLSSYLNTLSSGIFIVGFITTYLFSRLFGRKVFWYAVMDEHYFRAVKNAAEECLELYGYLLILIAVTELLVMVFTKKGLTEKMATRAMHPRPEYR